MRYRESQDLLPIPHQLLSRLPMDPLLLSMPMVESAASGCGGIPNRRTRRARRCRGTVVHTSDVRGVIGTSVALLE